jgi:hypothetical protein
MSWAIASLDPFNNIDFNSVYGSRMARIQFNTPDYATEQVSVIIGDNERAQKSLRVYACC